jgi:hypothetical protein
MQSGTMPPLCTTIEPRSIPAIEELARNTHGASAP